MVYFKLYLILSMKELDNMCIHLPINPSMTNMVLKLYQRSPACSFDLVSINANTFSHNCQRCQNIKET